MADAARFSRRFTSRPPRAAKRLRFAAKSNLIRGGDAAAISDDNAAKELTAQADATATILGFV